MFFIIEARVYLKEQEFIILEHFLLYQRYTLHMARVDGIDVCGTFFMVSVRGNMLIGF